MNVKTSLEMSKDINKPEQLITEHIDIWTSSILAKSTSGRGSSKKYELYGISKLRELILELAVRGKLVPQDANDEPASVLLEKIAVEKAHLIENSKVEKNKSLPNISNDEKWFSLPSGWKWVRFGELFQVKSGNNLSKSKMKDGDIPVFGGNGITGYHNESNVEKSTIVIGRVGYYCGSVHLTPPEAWITDNAFFTTYDEKILFQDFVIWLLKTIDLQANTSSTAQPVISGSKIYPIVIPLPPIEEQKRIVAKVDELMLLCDQLEQQTEASIEAHATLVEVLLATLTDSADADELAQNWARVADHFDSLFTNIKSINSLKQTVIRLAVHGKLVSQDLNDESVSVQLEKINDKKSELVKNGDVKVRSLPKITDEEVSSDLPVGWGVIRLGNAMNVLNGRAYKKHEMLQDGTPLLRVGNLFTSKEWYYSDLELEPNKYINNGDLIYAWSASFGPFIWEGDKVIYHYHIWKLDLYDDTALSKAYLYNYLLSITEEIKASGNGIAMIHMTKARMEELILPIPPLAEQHRIVSKIGELMAICDQLKERLQQSQETQVQLTDALIDKALG